uniref:Protein kinase domain containing protein n=1 Tax=Strombidium rassoulzadegani TaxID=1082188 RepID=A0A7S3CK80_9SPIT|mmetsp:Transcript_14164/g.24074  ORF Transcript_14164/g.24074 Transcript_14164/m.24074 type:complete len:358 (+) Transcript_14164:471-1544(+)
MKQIFSALQYLHSNKISHRDIKPENFMLYQKEDLTCIKMIDFGLSKDFSQQGTMSTMSGSPYYIAPEVFLQKYNQQIDIWSMGVVLYIMLSGKVPFPGRDEREIIQNVIRGEFHFNHQAFQNVSEDCKDLINKCLIKDFRKRITAVEALKHPWIISKSDAGPESGTIGGGVSNQVLQGIDEILKCSKVKDAALNYLSQKVTPNNIEALQDALKNKDSEGSGFLPNEEFVRCLSMTHMKVTDREVQKLVEQLDGENSGKVNYQDFLKFSYLCQLYLNHYKLEVMLNELDTEKRGLITVAQLDEILQKSDHFNFPSSALDLVFTEMLGQNINNVDRNCIIKIEAFLESLKSQFEKQEGS